MTPGFTTLKQSHGIKQEKTPDVPESLWKTSDIYSGLQVRVILMNIQKVKLLRISFLGLALAFSLGYLVASLLVCVSQGDPILFMSVTGSHKTILRTPRCGSRVSGAVTLIYTPEVQPPQNS